jgi:hypothetical protein
MDKELKGAELFASTLKRKDYKEIIKWAEGEIKEYEKLIKIIKNYEKTKKDTK